MKNKIIKMIIYVIILSVLIPVSIFADLIEGDKLKKLFSVNIEKIALVIIMWVSVLIVQNIVIFCLDLIKSEKHRTQSILSLTKSIIKYSSFILILVWGLTIMGVNISTVFASVGVIALIVGFSAESLIADLVTGIFILFENQYNVGDIVEVNGFRGTVSSIGMRTTRITDPGDNIKIINNSDMKNILNRSDRASRSVATIGIPYATDLEKLESEIPALMEKILQKYPELYRKAPTYLGVEELADSAVVLKFVGEVSEKDVFSGARTLNKELLLGFRSLGVECPFPQVDAHIDQLKG